jgi:hypothetical protein
LVDPIRVAVASRDFDLLGLAMAHRGRATVSETASSSHLHSAVRLLFNIFSRMPDVYASCFRC